jgi:uncharacterized delta-60 repeat protein
MKQILLVTGIVISCLQSFSQGYDFNTAVGVEGTKYFGDGHDNNSSVAKALETTSGKILLAVNSNAGSQIIQLNADGTRDQSFYFNGLSGQQTYFSIADMAIDPNTGSIVFVANYPNYSTSSYFVVVRLRSDGVIDQSFAQQYISYGASSTVASGIDVYEDGSIIVGGSNYQFGGSAFQHAIFTKFLSSGQLDNSFDGDGKLTTTFGSTRAGISDVHFDEYGNIMFCGTTVNANAQGVGWENFIGGRLLPSGAFDGSFNGSGYSIVNMSNVVSQEYDYGISCGIQTDGKLLVAGNANYNNSPYLAVVRFNENGSLDNSFDGDGKLYLRNVEGNNFYNCTDIIVTGGSNITRHIFLGCKALRPGQNYDSFGIIALNGSGASYGYFNNGAASSDIHNFAGASQYNYLNSLLVLGDGSVLAAGTTTGFSPDGSRYSLEKFNAGTGNLDPGFAGTGFICSQLDKIGGQMQGITSDPAGNIYALEIFPLSARQTYVNKFDNSGNPNQSFGTQGSSDISSLDPNIYYNDLESDHSGGIYVLGYDPQAKISIVHLLANGNPDASFGTGGLKQLNYATSLPVIRKSDPNGNLYLGSYNNNNIYLLHLDATGTEDASFSSNANPIQVPGTANNRPQSIQLQSDGKILLLIEYYNGGYYERLERFNTNGTLDLNFGIGGFVDLGAGQTGQIYLDASDNIYYCALSLDYQSLIWKKMDTNGTPVSGSGTGEISGDNAGQGYSVLNLNTPTTSLLCKDLNNGQIFCSALSGVASVYTKFIINSDGTRCTTCLNTQIGTIPYTTEGIYRVETGVSCLPDHSIVIGGYKTGGYHLSCFLQFLSPPLCSPVIITQQPQETQTLCQDQTPVTLHVSATGTINDYQWYVNNVGGNTSGQMIAAGPDFTPPVSTPGTKYYYCVLVSDCGNVTSNASEVIVSQFLNPSVEIMSVSNFCAGQQQFLSAFVTGAGDNFEYHWLVDNVEQNNNNAMFSFTPLGGEQVTCQVIVSGGCSINGSMAGSNILMMHQPLAAEYVKQNKSACSGIPDGTIWVNATGGSGQYSFEWTGVIGSGNPASTPFPDPGNASSLTGLEYGFYNVLITDQNGCGSLSIPDIHIQNAYLPYITTSGSNSSTCAPTGKIMVYATAAVAPYSYRLDNGTAQNDNLFSNVAAGVHTVTVTDARGCSSSKIVTIQAVQNLSLSFNVTPASSCNNDGMVKINRIGGIPPYEFKLDGGSFGTGNIFSGLSAGIHVASIRDAAGCIASGNFTVNQGPGLNITYSKVNSSACVSDGSIQVIVSGGSPPYLYSINAGPAQSSNHFSTLAAGNYTVTATDQRNCFNTINVTLNVNNIQVTYLKQDAPSCAGTGWIKVLRTGGVNPYTYSLDGNNYTSDNYFNNLPPGTYTAFVKDAKTCVGQDNILLGPSNCETQTRLSNASIEPGSSTLSMIYPNPFTDKTRLVLKGGENGEFYKISLTDREGRVLQKITVHTGMVEIGGDLSVGVYYLVIVGRNITKTYKIVKL